MKKKLSKVLHLIHIKRVWPDKAKEIILIFFSLLAIISFFLLIQRPTGNTSYLSFKKVTPSEDSNIIAANEIDPTKIKILFTGDIMLARSIGWSIQNGKDPFEHVKDFFSNYDIVVGNLETTIAGLYTGFAASKGYTFKAPVSAATILANAGVDIVSLANNHTMDYGEDALFETIASLDSAGVGHFGAGANFNEAYQPFYIQFKNTRIAIFGFNNIERWITDVNEYHGGNAYFDESRIRGALKDAQDNSDIVIVFPHWGEEYTSVLTDDQKYWSHFFIDNGADFVVGSHPHVIQESEVYKGKVIYYSLGNFVFDGMYGIQNASRGGMVEVNIIDKKVSDSKEFFVNLGWDGFPALSD